MLKLFVWNDEEFFYGGIAIAETEEEAISMLCNKQLLRDGYRLLTSNHFGKCKIYPLDKKIAFKLKENYYY